MHTKLKSDTVRVIGWANIGVSLAAVYFAPSMVTALIGACFWIIAVLGVTQAVAWRMDRKDNELRLVRNRS
jgi:hypothetical protein